jgi:D-alanyl-D-alanine carboxypeptidase
MTRLDRRWRGTSLGAGVVFTLSASMAWASPSLVIDVATGNILHQEQAATSWYPASLTKLMTAYVALKAAQEGRIKLETPLVVSVRATRAAPSKMGFKPGTEVTLDNALKMLMVKSANDIAITIAEGVSGSVEGFATEMNTYAVKLGMRESYFDNPNGLPDNKQVASARDMAVVARALYTQFPEQHDLFGIEALQLGNQIIETHNGLLGRIPGVDGGKTGFTCASGFNIVASATRGGRHLLVVVLGASTVRERNREAAMLLETSFAGQMGSSGTLDNLPSNGVTQAPDIRAEVCGRHPHAEAMGEEGDQPSKTMMDPAQRQTAGLFSIFTQPATAPATAQQISAMLAGERQRAVPVPVYIGPAPGWTGPVAGSPDAVAYASDKAKLEGSAAIAAAMAAAGPVQLSGAKSLIEAKSHSAHGKKAVAKPRLTLRARWLAHHRRQGSH